MVESVRSRSPTSEPILKGGFILLSDCPVGPDFVIECTETYVKLVPMIIGIYARFLPALNPQQKAPSASPLITPSEFSTGRT